jgi:hypothetical protein
VGVADNEFGTALIAEIKRYHEMIEREREAVYFEPLEDLVLSATTTTHGFRVINGGRSDHLAWRGR